MQSERWLTRVWPDFEDPVGGAHLLSVLPRPLRASVQIGPDLAINWVNWCVSVLMCALPSLAAAARGHCACPPSPLPPPLSLSLSLSLPPSPSLRLPPFSHRKSMTIKEACQRHKPMVLCFRNERPTLRTRDTLQPYRGRLIVNGHFVVFMPLCKCPVAVFVLVLVWKNPGDLRARACG